MPCQDPWAKRRNAEKEMIVDAPLPFSLRPRSSMAMVRNQYRYPARVAGWRCETPLERIRRPRVRLSTAPIAAASSDSGLERRVLRSQCGHREFENSAG